MNDKRTTSILQRLPVILAVTAVSYGLASPVSARTANPQHQEKAHQAQPAKR